MNNNCFLPQQERLADKILSEGLEQLDKRPEEKQAEVRQGTPAEVRSPVLVLVCYNIIKILKLRPFFLRNNIGWGIQGKQAKNRQGTQQGTSAEVWSPLLFGVLFVAFVIIAFCGMRQTGGSQAEHTSRGMVTCSNPGV